MKRCHLRLIRDDTDLQWRLEHIRYKNALLQILRKPISPKSQQKRKRARV